MTRMQRKQKRQQGLVNALIIIFVVIAIMYAWDVWFEIEETFGMMEKGAITTHEAEVVLKDAKELIAELDAMKLEWLQARVEGV